MIKPYAEGTELTCKETREVFYITKSNGSVTHYENDNDGGWCQTSHVAELFVVGEVV